MTISPEELKNTIQPNFKIEGFKLSALEDLFAIGYTTSEEITVYKDEEAKIELKVRFRTLTPIEFRDVFESCADYNTLGAQSIMEKIEKLARSITHINGMPLILNSKDSEDFNKKYGRSPSPLDQARYILIEKIRSVHILDAIYDAYAEFADTVKGNFEDIKKKLKSPTSSK